MEKDKILEKIKNFYRDLKLTKENLVKTIISGILGLIIAMFTSNLVNITLIEISVNPFFSIVDKNN